MMSGEITTFANLPVGSVFWCNGNVCHKVSQRTAKIACDEVVYGTFYFSPTEVVTRGVPA